jgi:hypothetical protein
MTGFLLITLATEPESQPPTIQNSFINVTSCCNSSSERCSSFCGDPIKNVPGSHQRNVCRTPLQVNAIHSPNSSSPQSKAQVSGNSSGNRACLRICTICKIYKRCLYIKKLLDFFMLNHFPYSSMKFQSIITIANLAKLSMVDFSLQVSALVSKDIINLSTSLRHAIIVRLHYLFVCALRRSSSYISFRLPF